MLASRNMAAAVIKENPLVELPPEIMMIGRVFGLLSGISKHLDARTNLPEVFRPYLDGELATAEASDRA